MQKNSRLFRLTASVALTALLSDTVLLSPLAVAQPAPPPLPAPGQGRPDLNQNQGDPPARVGRIAGITGTVSFHNLGDTQWSAATLNYPVASGNAFWTEPSSESQLEVSDCRIAMAPSTEFDVSTLDASGLQGIAPQGQVYLHLRDLAPNESWSIQTPRGLVQISGEGRYDIVVGTTDQPTLVTVIDGAAQLTGTGVSVQVAANQTATVTGTDTFQAVIGPAQRDAFLTERLNAERPPAVAAAGVPTQVVYAMAGGSDLVGTGNWGQAPQYGQVWYPPVAANWVPYREGHWAYVAPWGWTWVDDASWGFAPFHYGRWVQIEGRWAWTPGEVRVDDYRPVYAPALVTFIGIGAGIAIGAAIASGSIGWVPLGPHEEYHPWYHASNNYVRQVNITHVTNITNITNNNVTINNYVNRGAATSVPAAAMTASRPVQAVARPVTPQEFAAARPITGQQPLRPTAATAGVTPVVARQMSLAPAPAAVHAAPGPAVRPAAAGTAGFARPTFAPVEKAQAPAATEPGRPVPATPGARPAVTPAPEAARPATTTPTPPHPAPSTATRPETARPETARPETARPETARPETARPEAVRPETARPEAARPETARPAAAPHPEAAASHPVARPAPRPEARPEAAPRPEARPAVAPHPEARPEAAPRPEARPEAAPHPEARPAQAPQERKKEPGEK